MSLDYVSELRTHYAAVRARVNADPGQCPLMLPPAPAPIAPPAIDAWGMKAKGRHLPENVKLRQDRLKALREAGHPPTPFVLAATLTLTRPMLARTIIRETAEKYGLTVGNLTGPSRVIEVCAARFEAMYRIRKELGQSLPTIGRLFGGRDHTTVMAAIHRHEARLARAAEGEEAE